MCASSFSGLTNVSSLYPLLTQTTWPRDRRPDGPEATVFGAEDHISQCRQLRTNRMKEKCHRPVARRWCAIVFLRIKGRGHMFSANHLTSSSANGARNR